MGGGDCDLAVFLLTRFPSDPSARLVPGPFFSPFRLILRCYRFSADITCDAYKYEIDVEQGVVVSHGPAAPTEGALGMELPTVSFESLLPHP